MFVWTINHQPTQQPTMMPRHSSTSRWIIALILLVCEGVAFSRSVVVPQQHQHFHDGWRGVPIELPRALSTSLRNPPPHASSRTALHQLRGGGGAITATFNRFASYIGASRTRCLMVLVGSILLETVATGLSKRAKDTGNVATFLVAVGVYIGCMIGFNLSLAKIDVSVAYAMWSAFGTFLVTIVGTVFFRETVDWVKFLYVAMIVLGVVGLNLR